MNCSEDATPARFRHSEQEPLARVVLPSGDSAVAATRHADVRMVMSDPRFTRELTYPGAPRQLAGADLNDDPDLIVNMDPPRHTRLRRLVSKPLQFRIRPTKTR